MQPRALALKAAARASGWAEDRYGNLKCIRPDGQTIRLKFQRISVRLERNIATPGTPANWLGISTVYDAEIQPMPGKIPGWRIGRHIIGLEGVCVQMATLADVMAHDKANPPKMPQTSLTPEQTSAVLAALRSSTPTA